MLEHDRHAEPVAMTEDQLRFKLGIPQDASRVLVVLESSHWDPNWLLTSRESFKVAVCKNLEMALGELAREPRRIYCVECAFFLKMFWDARPSRRGELVEHLSSGHLRLLGTGVTTPDTILPSVESIIRDYQIGSQWYRSIGVDRQTRVAYLPDSFGHAPTVPGILRALGVSGVGICRIDGQYLVGRETDSKVHFPRPNTSADLLMNRERSQDFIWRGPGGAEVLAHWMAYGYGFGQMLAHNGLTRAYRLPLARPARSIDQVADKINRFARRLSRTSRTPYLLCPTGFDFVPPIHGLVDLLDGYNQNNYPTSGTWATCLGFDDYLDLVGFHRDNLPTIELDPNPYFSGFYTSRATLKTAAYLLARRLLETEASIALSQGDISEDEKRVIESSWWISAVSNHHDFITGTSPNRVAQNEQISWLKSALDTLENDMVKRIPTSHKPVALVSSGVDIDEVSIDFLKSYELRDGPDELRITAGFGEIVFDKARGGEISKFMVGQQDWVSPGKTLFELASYRDSGGLWRMGMEYIGGTFELVETPSRPRSLTKLTISPNDNLEIHTCSRLDGMDIERWYRIMRVDKIGPIIVTALRLAPRKDRTVTVRVGHESEMKSAIMDMPGGWVVRPSKNYYEPTFWPFQSFAYLGTSSGLELGVFSSIPKAVAVRDEQRSLEVVLARNARMERHHRTVPVPGMPVYGTDGATVDVHLGLVRTLPGTLSPQLLRGLARRLSRICTFEPPPGSPFSTTARMLAIDQVKVSGDDVEILAVKPAARGGGVIIRLQNWAQNSVICDLSVSPGRIDRAVICNALEDEISTLEVSEGRKVRAEIVGTLATVKVWLSSEVSKKN